nr:hypothetical protein [Mesorhizobium sp.]
MTKTLKLLLLAMCLAPAGGFAAHADDGVFLNSLEGKWMGKGTVRVRTNSSPINVNCKFSTDASDTSLSLDGNCTGLLIINRAIGADLKANGTEYSGSYTGAGTGKAGLNGSRSGNSINLGISWAKEVNGDRVAQMTVEKVGDNGLRLTTVDEDPKTGEKIVTSTISLNRI